MWGKIACPFIASPISPSLSFSSSAYSNPLLFFVLDHFKSFLSFVTFFWSLFAPPFSPSLSKLSSLSLTRRTSALTTLENNVKSDSQESTHSHKMRQFVSKIPAKLFTNTANHSRSSGLFDLIDRHLIKSGERFAHSLVNLVRHCENLIITSNQLIAASRSLLRFIF